MARFNLFPGGWGLIQGNELNGEFQAAYDAIGINIDYNHFPPGWGTIRGSDLNQEFANLYASMNVNGTSNFPNGWGNIQGSDLNQEFAAVYAAMSPMVPPWLPAAPNGDYPIIYSDFANGNYYMNNQIVGVDDIWEVGNADWGQTWDPATDIVPGKGIIVTAPVFNVVGPVFTTPAFNLLNELIFTLVFNSNDPGPAIINRSFIDFQGMAPGGNFPEVINEGFNNYLAGGPNMTSGSSNVNFDNAVSNQSMAVSFKTDTLTGSYNGSDIQSCARDPGYSTQDFMGILMEVSIGTPIPSCPLVIIYPLLPDSNLPILSGA